MNLERAKKKWMRKWNDAKEDIVDALRDPEIQSKWKRETLKPETIQERREKLIEAINAGLIEAGLAEVDPAEWASETIEGIQNTTVDEKDADEWERNFSDYAPIIEEGKRELERRGLKGLAAGHWWLDHVCKKLHEKKLEKGRRFRGRRVEIAEVT